MFQWLKRLFTTTPDPRFVGLTVEGHGGQRTTPCPGIKRPDPPPAPPWGHLPIGEITGERCSRCGRPNTWHPDCPDCRLEMLKEQVKKHFPDSYAVSVHTQGGVIWAVYQSTKHIPFGVKETELEAWESAARWIPMTAP